MDVGKFGIGQVEGKIDSNDFNEVFEIDAVKIEPSDIFANHSSFCNSSSRSRTDFEDHNHFTNSYRGHNEEKLDVKDLDPKDLGHSKCLQILSTSKCSTVGIKHEDIDIFHEDIKCEAGEEKSRERIGFCEEFFQSFDGATDSCKSSNNKSECSYQKQNESLLYNRHSDDTRIDLKPFLLDPTSDSGLKPIKVQDDMISEDEVTKEGDSSAVARRLLVLSTENYNEMKHNLSPVPLESNLSVDKKKLQCKICLKYLSYSSDSSHLKVHERGHTGEKPFHCKICSKSFSQKSNMNAHMRVHTGEKPFCCKLCSKAFSKSAGLWAHAKIHTEDKLFCCKICSKAFTTSRYLKNHARIHT